MALPQPNVSKHLKILREAGLVDVYGRVADSRLANSSGHELLDRAARDALALCRFTPGTVDGEPERAWAHMRYRWRLDR